MNGVDASPCHRKWHTLFWVSIRLWIMYWWSSEMNCPAAPMTWFLPSLTTHKRDLYRPCTWSCVFWITSLHLNKGLSNLLLLISVERMLSLQAKSYISETSVTLWKQLYRRLRRWSVQNYFLGWMYLISTGYQAWCMKKLGTGTLDTLASMTPQTCFGNTDLTSCGLFWFTLPSRSNAWKVQMQAKAVWVGLSNLDNRLWYHCRPSTPPCSCWKLFLACVTGSCRHAYSFRTAGTDCCWWSSLAGKAWVV